MKEVDNVTKDDGMLNEFEQWLGKSSCRFSNSLVVFHEGSECLEVRFDRVAPELGFTICKNGNAGIWVTYQDEVWDCIAEFDVWERHTPSGQYYCEGCNGKKLYSSRKSLWENHIFEPLLDWTNKNLSTSNWLCIFKIDGVTCASIASENSIESAYTQNGFVVALPVVENFPRHNQQGE